MANANTYRPQQQTPPQPNQAKKRSRLLITNMDYTIYLVVAILTFTGIVMVFSASYLTTATDAKFGNDPFYFVRRTLGWAALGFVAMNVMANIKYSIIKKFAYLFYLVVLPLLLLVGVLDMGITAGGASRWLSIPVIGQFQPSELAKAAIVFFLARLIADKPDRLRDIKNFIFAFGAVGLVAGLIALTSMSSAIIVAVIGFGMIFIASPHILRFVLGGLVGAGGVAGYLFYVWRNMENNVSGAWRGGRVAAWIDPFSDPLNYGFQPINSLYAIASGGLFGLGIGQSRQTTFLPEAHNDMVFAIICEELGLVGAGVVLLLFGIYFWRGIRVAVNAPDTFGSMTAAGIVLIIASQVIINVAVVTNSIPNTGVTLPFISYGGTSLAVCMTLSGVLLNISRYTKE